MSELVLVGQPNAGKTSLFNQLTGLNQKVGNYAGVTVQVKTGQFQKKKVTDLPGLYSLDTNSPEEVISKNYLLDLSPSGNTVLFVANGMQLEESLVLFSQVADLQLPSIFVINFKDEMQRNQLQVDERSLQQRLGCPVVSVNSNNGDGFDDLRRVIDKWSTHIPKAINLSAHAEVKGMEVDNYYRERLQANVSLKELETDYSSRVKAVEGIVRESVQGLSGTKYLSKTKQWDHILLHPVWGVLIFLFILFLVFQAVFSLSSYPMDWIDATMGFLVEWVNNTLPEGWFRSLLADGIIAGIGGVIIFIPQIAILFLLLGILEHTGYLARISFISDVFLKRFGLSGHSVIPLMTSWACAIPAIMSTRIITNPRERLALIFASPLMTCSARLPVYTILIAILFPADAYFGAQGFALLLLYLLGVVATLVVAWLVSKNTQEEEQNYWILELPIFRMPNWRNIIYSMYLKTKSFVVEAGKVILFISIVLWFLASYSPHNEARLQELHTQEQATAPANIEVSQESVNLEYSYLGYAGKAIEPVIRPLGYDWKIGIALISSFAAREVFVGTLATIYSIESEEEMSIVQRLQSERVGNTERPRYDWATSISLLLFYVFALQCMSTVAIVKKETGTWKYAIIQFVFMLVLAYVFAFGAYQLLSF